MPTWASNVAELAVFYALGVALLTVALLMASRYMGRHPHRISPRRVEEVREYTRDWRIYVPQEWTKERSR